MRYGIKATLAVRCGCHLSLPLCLRHDLGSDVLAPSVATVNMNPLPGMVYRIFTPM